MSINDCDCYGGSGQLVDEVTNGISIGARAVVELRDPCRVLMAELSSANDILHLRQVISRE